MKTLSFADEPVATSADLARHDPLGVVRLERNVLQPHPLGGRVQVHAAREKDGSAGTGIFVIPLEVLLSILLSIEYSSFKTKYSDVGWKYSASLGVMVVYLGPSAGKWPT